MNRSWLGSILLCLPLMAALLPGCVKDQTAAAPTPDPDAVFFQETPPSSPSPSPTAEPSASPSPFNGQLQFGDNAYNGSQDGWEPTAGTVAKQGNSITLTFTFPGSGTRQMVFYTRDLDFVPDKSYPIGTFPNGSNTLYYSEAPVTKAWGSSDTVGQLIVRAVSENLAIVNVVGVPMVPIGSTGASGSFIATFTGPATMTGF